MPLTMGKVSAAETWLTARIKGTANALMSRERHILESSVDRMRLGAAWKIKSKIFPKRKRVSPC
jgi:hypothetical protein